MLIPNYYKLIAEVRAAGGDFVGVFQFTHAPGYVVTYYGLPCDTCAGTGKEECWDCRGRKEFRCSHCDGTGDCPDCGHSGACNECGGAGYNDCDTCNGTGRVACEDCQGHGYQGHALEDLTWAERRAVEHYWNHNQNGQLTLCGGDHATTT